MSESIDDMNNRVIDESDENVHIEKTIKKKSLLHFKQSIKDKKMSKETNEDIRQGYVPVETGFFGIEAQTMYEFYLLIFTRYKDNRFIGHRKFIDGKAGPYIWKNYIDVWEKANKLSDGLMSLSPANQECIGIMSKNRPEVVYTEYACHKNNLIIVHTYEQGNKADTEHVINETEMKIIFCGYEGVRKLLSIQENLSTLETIILLEDFTNKIKTEDILKEYQEKKGKFEIIPYRELLTKKSSVPNIIRPTADDICYIVYTSGTTGRPKGVVIEHKMMISSLENVNSSIKNEVVVTDGKGRRKIKQLTDFGPDDTHLSYLPFAHILEKLIFSLFALNGMKIGTSQGDPRYLLDDIQELKPTFFVAVPRVLNRFYEAIYLGVSEKGWISKRLFEMAVNSKLSYLHTTGEVEHSFWDSIVFSKIKNIFGGRIRGFFSGSAPLTAKIADFLKICFSCELFQGYGQTETTGSVSVSIEGDIDANHAGSPFPGVRVKLIDVPELGFTTKDMPLPRGEICVKSKNCFQKYFKNPEATNETIVDGWMKTGDIGAWDKKGRLCIIDRKSSVIKLSQGEYVHPEKIETVLSPLSFIEQCFVYGESTESYLIAIIVPEKKYIVDWAVGKVEGTYEEICRNEETVKHILSEINTKRKAGDIQLSGIEVPRKVYLEPSAFTIDEDLLTTTLKLKRKNLKKKYREAIKGFY
eukprot:GHVP01063669.1.p1 GENE.GHVP01063669.1~~GHVP01063669.1.p1  ORF type:complete len:697 (-),score=117.18 GHVP01063669.1:919-3009(-)